MYYFRSLLQGRSAAVFKYRLEQFPKQIQTQTADTGGRFGDHTWYVHLPLC